MLISLRRLALLGLVAASSVVGKGAIGIKQGKVAVTSPDGLGDATYTLKEPTPLPSPITLTEGSTFKLSFSVIDTASGESVYPQQAHLLFEDPKGGDVTLPVSVKSNGKAQITINTAKPHPALLTTHGSFHLTLLLSSLDSLEPLAYPLGQLSLPPSILKPIPRKRHDLPPRQGEPAFQPQQEIFHTFKEDPKTVGWTLSIIGTVITLAPWTILLGLLGKISPSLNFQTPPVSSYIFLLVLGALEALIFVYWLRLKLYHLLPAFLGLSVIATYTGIVALRELRARRLKAGGAP
ncbi:oligosaccharyltransferase complex subunit delta (ribophorin II) [Kwoniella mangroviensis CBS 10435]|uniref:Oligosaccharyltransferase complex subunit delta (Ribophorin II) n=1 Tax=Kwoniella mangroviensis CBS 10435 TaxID=1331196 RepID=A0A1B9IIS3_9TREE|nr:oligosaccharyltransferase complex subunit delta (ribophorin II) [Kwoniella mangroviensis CBS 10435]